MEECIWGKGFLETYFSANNKAGISIFSLALTVFHVDEILKNSIARKHVEFESAVFFQYRYQCLYKTCEAARWQDN